MDLPIFDSPDLDPPASPTPAADPLADHLWLETEDAAWDLGPAEVDTDGDGVADSLTRNGPDGMTVYTDSDADGRVDKITAITADGEFLSRERDSETGAWAPTDLGRLF